MTYPERDALLFNDGDEVPIGVVLRDATEAIFDITGLTFSAEIWARDALVYETPTISLTVNNVLPDEAEDPEDQLPHLTVTLTEAQAAALPFGRLSYCKVVWVDGSGRTGSTGPIYLNKVLP